MRVGIPNFKGRVSSVFDWAQWLVVVDHDGHVERARREENLAAIAPPFRPAHLARLGMETLLCGGISRALAQMVQLQGITLMMGLAGETDKVLAAFFSGKLPNPRFAMPSWSFALPPTPRAPRGAGKGHRHRHGRRRKGPGRH